MDLGRLWLVKLFEAEGLLLFGGDALALSQLTLHVLHLFPQVTVGFLQRAHLLRESPDPLLLLEQSLLDCGAHQLEDTEGLYLWVQVEGVMMPNFTSPSKPLKVCWYVSSVNSRCKIPYSLPPAQN